MCQVNVHARLFPAKFVSLVLTKLGDKHARLFGTLEYIETVDIAKIIKMGSLHAPQKWSFSEKKNWIELSKFMIKATT